MRAFSVWPLPEVKNLIQKHIWNEKVHISIKKNIYEHFNQCKKSRQMDFPLYFQILLDLGPGFFSSCRRAITSQEVLYMSPTKPQGCGNIRFWHDPIIIGAYLLLPWWSKNFCGLSRATKRNVYTLYELCVFDIIIHYNV